MNWWDMDIQKRLAHLLGLLEIRPVRAVGDLTHDIEVGADYHGVALQPRGNSKVFATETLVHCRYQPIQSKEAERCDEWYSRS